MSRSPRAKMHSGAWTPRYFPNVEGYLGSDRLILVTTIMGFVVGLPQLFRMLAFLSELVTTSGGLDSPDQLIE
jgi:hypothetical protein